MSLHQDFKNALLTISIRVNILVTDHAKVSCQASIKPVSRPHQAHIKPASSLYLVHIHPMLSLSQAHVEPTGNPLRYHIEPSLNPSWAHIKPAWSPIWAHIISRLCRCLTNKKDYDLTEVNVPFWPWGSFRYFRRRLLLILSLSNQTTVNDIAIILYGIYTECSLNMFSVQNWQSHKK